MKEKHIHDRHDTHCGCGHDHAHDHTHTHCDCGHEHEHEHTHTHCDCEHGHHAHQHTGGGCAHCEAKLHSDQTLDKGTLARILVSGLLLIGFFFMPVGEWISLLLYLIPYLLVGYDVLWSAAKNIARGKLFDEQFLMTLATVGAFAVGEYPEAVAVMLFYQLGELLQTVALGRSRRSVAALMDIRPDVAVVQREGKEYTVSPEEVLVGEVIVVRPGERIPLDGVVITGETAVNNAALTGESVPIARAVGDRVISGGVNVSGLICVKVESTYHESTVSRVLELAEHAADRKAHIERFITRFSRYYTPVVVLLALLVAFVPPLVLHQPFGEWIYRALSFLVVSCPCALVISVPLSFFCGIGAASRQGILVKGAEYLEQLSRVDVVAFDKTGTITKGAFGVVAVRANDMSEHALLQIAAAVESRSTHPIAAGILRAYGEEPPAITGVTECAGKGIVATLGECEYAVGNVALMREFGVDAPEASPDRTTVYVAQRGRYLGCIELMDEVREDAAKALLALKRCGVTRSVMLTGDKLEIATHVASVAGVDEVAATLLPDGKVAHLEALIDKGHCVAFVGDGINDAPVLARADVGIAMGGIGSDAAIETADVVLMDDHLTKLPRAVGIAKKTMRIVRENIAFALAAKAVILVLAALGIANMWIAVFGDVGVMLIAICNALRVARYSEKKGL